MWGAGTEWYRSPGIGPAEFEPRPALDEDESVGSFSSAAHGARLTIARPGMTEAPPDTKAPP